MKIFKLGLRLWITVTSLFSFFTGWVTAGPRAQTQPIQLLIPATNERGAIAHPGTPSTAVSE